MGVESLTVVYEDKMSGAVDSACTCRVIVDCQEQWMMQLNEQIMEVISIC